MGRVAFLFPGQGAQTVGMGRQLYDELPAARALFDSANEILDYDLARICFHGPPEKLDSTVHSQPALFVTSLAALEWMRRHRADVVASCEAAAGLSLGEFTALTFAGALDFETGLRVVQQRGEAMQAASDARSSGMVSILGLDAPRLAGLCASVRQGDEVLQIANFLCPGTIAVSGNTGACQRLGQAALEAGAMRAVPLAVAGAFHTPLMQSAVERLAAALADAPIRRPRLPVISNVDAQPHEDPDEIRQILVRQVVSPVLWEDSMRRLLSDGFGQYYEVGPGRVLAGLLKRIERKIPCESIAC